MLEARGIRKQFPGVLALDGVDVSLHIGEAVAIVGENGAGKSTLMKILAGIHQPDSGELFLDGKPAVFPNVQSAASAGIRLIHQELNLAENLSVTANIFLGRELTRWGVIADDAAMRSRAVAALQRVGLPSALASARVGRLAPGQKQLVEIARALAMNVRLIIMDEPTSSLTQAETDRLGEVIVELKAQGVAIAYISHRLAEVKRIADRAVVLRDGRNAGELNRADINHDNLVRLMVGRELKTIYPRLDNSTPPTGDMPALSIRNLTYRGGTRHPFSLDLQRGEILGMAGLVGAGRTEVAEAIFGLRAILTGDVLVEGRPVTIRHPRDALRAGLAMVPEDRRAHGLLMPEGAGFNVSLPNLAALSRWGLVKEAEVRRTSETWISRLRIRTPSLWQPVANLSGGNQQKVVFAKWLAHEPRVLILDEPTRGVDVGARGEIYAIIADLAAQGLAVWMISSDMEELLGMSHRIAVMHEGRLAGVLERGEFSEAAVMNLATGGG